MLLYIPELAKRLLRVLGQFLFGNHAGLPALKDQAIAALIHFPLPKPDLELSDALRVLARHVVELDRVGLSCNASPGRAPISLERV